jgi:hypothetical protein
MSEREIPEAVRREVADRLRDTASLMEDDPAAIDAYRLAARALNGELRVEVMREIAERLAYSKHTNSVGCADAIDAWADELEASMKGGDDGDQV